MEPKWLTAFAGLGEQRHLEYVALQAEEVSEQRHAERAQDRHPAGPGGTDRRAQAGAGAPKIGFRILQQPSWHLVQVPAPSHRILTEPMSASQCFRKPLRWRCRNAHAWHVCDSHCRSPLFLSRGWSCSGREGWRLRLWPSKESVPRRLAALEAKLLRFQVQQKQDADFVREYERQVQLALCTWVQGAWPRPSSCSAMLSVLLWQAARACVAAPRWCFKHWQWQS